MKKAVVTISSKTAFHFALAALCIPTIRFLFIRKEEVACKVIRETLEATYKVNDWMAEEGRSNEGLIPEIPFSLVQQCGANSFKMKYPFKFQFDENPPSKEELVEIFQRRNKMIYTRKALTDELLESFTPFKDVAVRGYEHEKMSFNEAWPEISKGKRILYFDNTWEKDDFLSIMSRGAIQAMMSTSLSFGSMFMNNYKKRFLTATAHSAHVKSIATQMYNAKEWVFIDPKVQKKYLASELVRTVTVPVPMTQNHDDVLKSIPHYRVITPAGYGVYFPAYWTHIVYTEPGLNIMTNWRQPAEIMDAWSSPHSFRSQAFLAFATFLDEYILPDFVSKKLKTQGQDSFQNAKQITGPMRNEIAAINSN